jgi:bacillaene synthase trans-acting acyltransferase
MSASKTVFMFSGQGSQYYQMGKPLFDGDDIFRRHMLRLDTLVQKLSGKRVLEAIHAGSKADAFDRTLLTHPAIFMTEYALALRLMDAGIEPDLTLGASLGSFAAATVAGCMSEEDAMAAVIEQAKSFENSCERGGIIAILEEPAFYEDEPFLHAHSEMAGVNFDRHFAVAARQSDLDAIEAELKRRGVTHQRLAVSFAFHSRWIDNAQAQFCTFMRTLPLKPATRPVVCCDRATTLGPTLPDEFFWSVVRRPIRFRDTIAQLERQGTHRYIDVGPSGTMATFVKYALPESSASTAQAVLTPYGHDQRNLDALLATT